MAVVALLAGERLRIRRTWPACARRREGRVTGHTLILDLDLRRQAVITVTTRTVRRFRGTRLRPHGQPGMGTGNVTIERVLVAFLA